MNAKRLKEIEAKYESANSAWPAYGTSLELLKDIPDLCRALRVAVNVLIAITDRDSGFDTGADWEQLANEALDNIKWNEK